MRNITLYIIAAVGLVCACSCHKEEAASCTQGRLVATASLEGQTKAAPVTSVPSFSAFGYTYSGGSIGTAGYMYDETFTKNGSTYTSENTYRFVPEGTNVFLWAVAPVGAAGVTLPSADAAGVPVLAFSVSSDVASQQDVIVAERSSNGLRGSVDFRFRHVLSSLRLRLAPAHPFEGTVKTVTLGGVRLDGSYAVGDGWTSVSNPQNVTVTLNKTITEEMAGQYLFTEAQTLMVPPQEFLSGAALSVVINDGIQDKTCTASLEGIRLEQGMAQVLSIGVDFAKARLSVTLTPWETSSHDIDIPEE